MPTRSIACSTVSPGAQLMTVSPCVILTVGVSLTAGLSVERVVAGAFGDGVAVDFHIFQGRLQMADDGVEMALCQPFFHHLRMRGPHILAGVVVRSAEDHRQERFLLRALFVHVGVQEEGRDREVVQDLAVKQIDSGFDRRLAADALIEALRHPVLVRC